MLNVRNLMFTSVAAVSLAFGTGAAPAHAQVVQDEEHCVINVKTSDVLNVRTKASMSSKVVTTLRYSDCGVVVTGACKGAWCPIETGHDAGWVNSRYISMVSPAMYCVAGVKQGDTLNLRAFPSSDSRILTKLARQQCDIALLPYSKGNWQKVRVNGFEGWVSRKFVSGE
ncbi:MAG: SH3 domain-containing protein [Sphingobacteriales bacterium]|nr:MAG: SH3 domain-containing protein [Sphingobacteriales bacterium]